MTAREKEHSGSASTITNGPPAGASAILGVRSAPVLSCCCAASMVPLLSPAPERTLSNPHQVQERNTETQREKVCKWFGLRLLNELWFLATTADNGIYCNSAFQTVAKAAIQIL